MRNWFAIGAIFATLLVALASIEAAPVAGEPVAVITNPWGPRSAIDVIADAQGSIVRVGRWSFLAVAADDGDASFHRRLRAAGAWLLLSPIAVGACLDDARIEPHAGLL
jgi:hypothetical protein